MAKTPTNISVGSNIRRLREDNHWSQQVIAEQLNISIPAYSKIETGVTDVNLSRLEQIASLFNTSIADLFSNGRIESYMPPAEYQRLQKELEQAEKEIVHLQRKVIQLYDELHQSG